MPDQHSQQATTQHLYAYWNVVRNHRIAPRRYEIEPMQIAKLLPETFIIDCGGLDDFRFRLAGTRLCEYFGRELRGQSLLDFWQGTDRTDLRQLLHRVVLDADIGTVLFDSMSDDERRAKFEMLVLPLIHNGVSINRLLGSITAIDAPIWLGTRHLTRHAILAIKAHAPANDTNVVPLAHAKNRLESAPTIVQHGNRRFRVYEGGLSEDHRE